MRSPVCGGVARGLLDVIDKAWRATDRKGGVLNWGNQEVILHLVPRLVVRLPVEERAPALESFAAECDGLGGMVILCGALRKYEDPGLADGAAKMQPVLVERVKADAQAGALLARPTASAMLRFWADSEGDGPVKAWALEATKTVAGLVAFLRAFSWTPRSSENLATWKEERRVCDPQGMASVIDVDELGRRVDAIPDSGLASLSPEDKDVIDSFKRGRAMRLKGMDPSSPASRYFEEDESDAGEGG